MRCNIKQKQYFGTLDATRNHPDEFQVMISSKADENFFSEKVSNKQFHAKDLNEFFKYCETEYGSYSDFLNTYSRLAICTENIVEIKELYYINIVALQQIYNLKKNDIQFLLEKFNERYFNIHSIEVQTNLEEYIKVYQKQPTLKFYRIANDLPLETLLFLYSKDYVQKKDVESKLLEMKNVLVRKSFRSIKHYLNIAIAQDKELLKEFLSIPFSSKIEAIKSNKILSFFLTNKQLDYKDKEFLFIQENIQEINILIDLINKSFMNRTESEEVINLELKELIEIFNNSRVDIKHFVSPHDFSYDEYSFMKSLEEKVDLALLQSAIIELKTKL